MTLAFLSYKGLFPLESVIICSFLGMMFTDIFWFLIVRSPVAKRFLRLQRVSEQQRRLEQRISSITQGKDMLILLVSKLLIGTRIFIILYISSAKITFKRFLFYNAPPTGLWAAFLGLFGWLAGAGTLNMFEIYNNYTVSSAIILLAVIVYYAGMRMMRKILIGGEND